MTDKAKKDKKPTAKPEVEQEAPVKRYKVAADDLSVGGIIARKKKGTLLTKAAVKALKKTETTVTKEVDGKKVEAKVSFLSQLIEAEAIVEHIEPSKDSDAG
jgi:hypothetical protein